MAGDQDELKIRPAPTKLLSKSGKGRTRVPKKTAKENENSLLLDRHWLLRI